MSYVIFKEQVSFPSFARTDILSCSFRARTSINSPYCSEWPIRKSQWLGCDEGNFELLNELHVFIVQEDEPRTALKIAFVWKQIPDGIHGIGHNRYNPTTPVQQTMNDIHGWLTASLLNLVSCKRHTRCPIKVCWSFIGGVGVSQRCFVLYIYSASEALKTIQSKDLKERTVTCTGMETSCECWQMSHLCYDAVKYCHVSLVCSLYLL